MTGHETVLTTGANAGLGLAIVLELARRGHRSVGSVRSEAKAELVHERAEAAGVSVETVVLDVTDAERCADVVHALPLTALVNNAGCSRVGAIEDTDDDQARVLFETMVLGPMRLARLALPSMRAAGRGRIIQMSSVMGRTSTPLGGWYSASKHALETLSDSLRMEVAGDGIQVIVLEPGGFKTDIWEDFARDIERLTAAGSRHVAAYQRLHQLQQASLAGMGEPGALARVVADAVERPRPRPRALVGTDARALTLVGAMAPRRAKDRLVRRLMHL